MKKELYEAVLNAFSKEGRNFEELVMGEMFQIAEECIKEEYNHKNHLIMVGFACEINRIISEIQNEEVRKKYDKKAEEIWERWYQKSENYRNFEEGAL